MDVKEALEATQQAAMPELLPMYVLTVKRDGGTQDVLGFYHQDKLVQAITRGQMFLEASRDSRRAIVRLEYYNPAANIATGSSGSKHQE